MTSLPITPDSPDIRRSSFPPPGTLCAVLLAATLPILAGCGGDSSSASDADTYPSRPIKVIVPFSAGGGTDTYARIIKKAFDENDLLPQPLVIINQGGAGGTIGSRRVKDAEPDGHTLLLLHDTILTAKYYRENDVDYGPEAFKPIAGTGRVGMVITVPESSPYRDLRELMEAARKQPGTIRFAANLGALTHFVARQLEVLTPGATFRITQSGGGAERFGDLRSGEADVTGFSIEEFVRFRSEGLRGLAFFGDQRHAAADDVPTAREQGFDAIFANTFYWWFPKGTPDDRVEVMAEALRQAMQTPYVQQKMRDIHCEPIFLRGPALRRQIAGSAKRLSSIAPRSTTPLPDFPMFTLIATAIVGALVLVTARRSSPHTSAGTSAATEPETASEQVDEVTAQAFAAEEDVPADLPLAPLRIKLAVMTFAATGIYVAVMAAGVAGFAAATIVYVIAAGGLLTRFRPRPLVIIVPLALVLGLGLQYLLTQVFVIDLP